MNKEKQSLLISLWTMQDQAVIDEINNKGFYVCDKNKSYYLSQMDDDEMLIGYKWIGRQMDRKGIYHPDNVEFPVWAWYAHDGKHKKPDLRSRSFKYCKYPFYCLKLEIPENEVLLSDFDDWHLVINNREKKEDNEIWYKCLLDINRKNLLRFHPYIQATFWILKREYIKRIQRFGQKTRK